MNEDITISEMMGWTLAAFVCCVIVVWLMTKGDYDE